VKCYRIATIETSKLLALARRIRDRRWRWRWRALPAISRRTADGPRRCDGCENDLQAERSVAAIFSRVIRESYLAYLRDDARVSAYETAIRRAVRPGMRVLEIGCGTGLFAMMAARAGAGRVISYEQNPSRSAMTLPARWISRPCSCDSAFS
jgi:SAM-dependent methyltransferase